MFIREPPTAGYTRGMVTFLRLLDDCLHNIRDSLPPPHLHQITDVPTTTAFPLGQPVGRSGWHTREFEILDMHADAFASGAYPNSAAFILATRKSLEDWRLKQKNADRSLRRTDTAIAQVWWRRHLTVRIKLFENKAERAEIVAEAAKLVRAFLANPPSKIYQPRWFSKAQLTQQLVLNVPTDLDIYDATFAVKNMWDLQDTDAALQDIEKVVKAKKSATKVTSGSASQNQANASQTPPPRQLYSATEYENLIKLFDDSSLSLQSQIHGAKVI